MIFATFMSIKDELTLRNNDLARKENDNLGVDKQILRQELGYTPIFIIPVLPSIYMKHYLDFVSLAHQYHKD